MACEELISIIIPVYNVEKYLNECLQSVVNQTYKHLEILLIDDGSTDASYEICHKFAVNDQRIRIFRKENGGAASARNAGLENATGTYVYFVDSDDYIMPNTVDVLYKAVVNTGSDCVTYDASTIVNPNYADACKKDCYRRKENYGTLSGHEMLIQFLDNKDFHSSVCLHFVKRDIIENHHLRFEMGIMFEDELFGFLLYYYCKTMTHLPQVLYNRRIREGSVMTTTGKNMFRFRSIKTVYDRLVVLHAGEKKPFGGLLKRYVGRNANYVIEKYRALDPDERKKVKNEYNQFRQELSSNHYYGNFGLRCRLMGEMIWMGFVLLRKIRRTILRGKLLCKIREEFYF